MRQFLPAICLGLLGLVVSAEAAEKFRPRTSSYLSRAIQKGYRQEDGRPETTQAAEMESPAEQVVHLPVMTVTAGQRLDARPFMVEEPPKPVLGTGVSEFRGHRCTLKIRRIFFIPVGFKLEW